MSSVNSTATKHNIFQIISIDIEYKTDKLITNSKHNNFGIALESLF